MQLDDVILIGAPAAVERVAKQRPASLISIADLARAPGETLSVVESRSFLVTVHGRPVAALVGLDATDDISSFDKTFTASVFNKQVSAVLEDVAKSGGAALITRYGKPTAAVVSAALPVAADINLLRNDPGLADALAAARRSVNDEGSYLVKQVETVGLADSQDADTDVDYQYELVPPTRTSLSELLIEVLRIAKFKPEAIEERLSRANPQQLAVLDFAVRYAFELPQRPGFSAVLERLVAEQEIAAAP